MDLSTIDEQVKTIVEQREINVDELIQNVDRLPQFTEEQIEKMLTAIPYYMQKLEAEITGLEILYDEAMANCKRIEAEYKLKSIEKKQSKELISEGDRASWVQCQKPVQDAQDKVLQIKGMLKTKQVLFNRYERNFVAVRKLASLINNVDVNMGVSQKYA